MRAKITIFLLLISISSLCSNKATKINFIPLPNQVEYTSGELKLPILLSLSRDFDKYSFGILARYLKTELQIIASEKANEDSDFRYIKDADLGEEEYRILVDTTHLEIHSSSPAGCLLAVQTVRQMLTQTRLTQSGQVKRIPALEIVDKPRYSWRSFHIDLARHMFTTDYLKLTIERLAYYKINKLHLHLNDDQGWRIEIDKYPLLTEVGAWREFDKYDLRCVERSVYNADMIIDKRFLRNDSIYGGFYTKNEMRDLIDYADKYGIEIIPEIDMPGHMSSAIKAYPSLSCVESSGWGKEFSHPICPCNLAVMNFAKDIYTEIAELFPSQYLHIGADEVERDTWENSKECKTLMKKMGMKSSDELQTYFVNEISSFLKAKGKTVLAWDDAALGNIDNDIHITYWRDWLPDNPRKIVEKGHPMIFTVWTHFYFSAWPWFDNWKGIYEFDITEKYPNMQASSVLGYQGCVWTEEIPTENKFEEHVYPSLQAFSELVWTNDSNRNWNYFLKRMKLHERMMDTEGIRYHVFDY